MSAHDTQHGGADDHGSHGHHVVSWQFLFGILVLLLILTGLTVYTALEVYLGDTGNLLLALFIASFKAALVVGFFMHLHWDNKFNAVALLFCLLAGVTFIGFTAIDIGSRHMVDPKRAEMMTPEVVKQARERAIAEGRLEPDNDDSANQNESPPE
ncbi:MAG: hypothetical protein EA376_12510 [Phycisphaeraceae bacterium]|nr:MAG: hypothetical protein EA376_12510 [Phycisphaeraceae bacterium]